MVLLIESKVTATTLCPKTLTTRPGVKSELCCMQPQDYSLSVSEWSLEELPFRVLPSAFMILVNESRNATLTQECNESQRKVLACFGLRHTAFLRSCRKRGSFLKNL